MWLSPEMSLCCMALSVLGKTFLGMTLARTSYERRRRHATVVFRPAGCRRLSETRRPERSRGPSLHQKWPIAEARSLRSGRDDEDVPSHRPSAAGRAREVGGLHPTGYRSHQDHPATEA